MLGMPIFGLEEKSLLLCETRSGMLAQNIANSETPNYKSIDLNFKEALNQASNAGSLSITNHNHLKNRDSVDDYKRYYRIPMQVNQDGNTVDEDIERQNFIENAMRYQAGLGFAQNKATGILKAIKGE